MAARDASASDWPRSPYPRATPAASVRIAPPNARDTKEPRLNVRGLDRVNAPVEKMTNATHLPPAEQRGAKHTQDKTLFRQADSQSLSRPAQTLKRKNV